MGIIPSYQTRKETLSQVPYEGVKYVFLNEPPAADS
jgi:hypothetical protein